MTEKNDDTSRRNFLKVSTLAGMTLPLVHAAENNTIQLALVGCGGRRTGAVENPLGVNKGPLKPRALAGGLSPQPGGKHRPPPCRLAFPDGLPPRRPLHCF